MSNPSLEVALLIPRQEENENALEIEEIAPGQETVIDDDKRTTLGSADVATDCLFKEI
jgi:hypothetical protein